MKIGLLGYGKMGQLIAQIAQERGHEVVAIIDPHHPQARAQEINAESVADAEVLIDFSQPDGAIANLEKASALGKNYVMGTTGWLAEMSKVQDIVQKSGIGFIWSSNFSLSVQLFFRIVREAAKMVNKFEEIDVAGVEAHHRHKLDAPSGTAESMAQILLEEIDRKKTLCLDRPQGKIKPEELHIATLRVGEVPGIHQVFFDSLSDTIEIKNTSRNRQGFALGAVLAAEFIAGKKGFYDFKDTI